MQANNTGIGEGVIVTAYLCGVAADAAVELVKNAVVLVQVHHLHAIQKSAQHLSHRTLTH